LLGVRGVLKGSFVASFLGDIPHNLVLVILSTPNIMAPYIHMNIRFSFYFYAYKKPLTLSVENPSLISLFSLVIGLRENN
jgi:hypothetical protein